MTDAVRGGHISIQKVLSKAENFGQPEPEKGSAASCLDNASRQADRKAIKNCFLEAAAMGDIAELRLCLTKGADVNDCDYDNRSALHLACSEGKLPVVNLLIGMQAQVDVVDRWGNVPLQDAMRQGHRDIVEVLRQAGAQLSRDSAAETELRACALASKGDLQGLSNLIECGVALNAADRDGRTPLHLAAAAGHLDAVDYLILKSADINAQDLKGDTPMGLAMLGKHAPVMHVLERAGATVPMERRASVRELRAGTSLLQAYYVSRERRAGTALLEAFPPSIAEAMMAGRAPEPISKECVSVFFSDIVGFTTISSKISASRVSAMLNRVFARFDRLAAAHGVQKVDIIGDAYLAATNFMLDQVRGPARPPRGRGGGRWRGRSPSVARGGRGAGPSWPGLVCNERERASPHIGSRGVGTSGDSDMPTRSEPGPILYPPPPTPLSPLLAAVPHKSAAAAAGGGPRGPAGPVRAGGDGGGPGHPRGRGGPGPGRPGADPGRAALRARERQVPSPPPLPFLSRGIAAPSPVTHRARRCDCGAGEMCGAIRAPGGAMFGPSARTSRAIFGSAHGCAVIGHGLRRDPTMSTSRARPPPLRRQTTRDGGRGESQRPPDG